MQFKSSLLGTAMVLAVSVGTAHAADQFTTLAGVPAQSLTAAQMEQVKGQWKLRLKTGKQGTTEVVKVPGTDTKLSGEVDKHDQTAKAGTALLESDVSSTSVMEP